MPMQAQLKAVFVNRARRWKTTIRTSIPGSGR